MPVEAGTAEDNGDDDEDDEDAAAGDDANINAWCASDDLAAEKRPDEARAERAGGGGGVDVELAGEFALVLPLGRSRSVECSSASKSDLMGARDCGNALTGVVGADTFFNVDSIVGWLVENLYGTDISGEVEMRNDAAIGCSACTLYMRVECQRRSEGQNSQCKTQTRQESCS